MYPEQFSFMVSNGFQFGLITRQLTLGGEYEYFHTNPVTLATIEDRSKSIMKFKPNYDTAYDDVAAMFTCLMGHAKYVLSLIKLRSGIPTSAELSINQGTNGGGTVEVKYPEQGNNTNNYPTDNHPTQNSSGNNLSGGSGGAAVYKTSSHIMDATHNQNVDPNLVEASEPPVYSNKIYAPLTEKSLQKCAKLNKFPK